LFPHEEVGLFAGRIAHLPIQVEKEIVIFFASYNEAERVNDIETGGVRV
jgi:hypothetical protein